MGVVAGAERHPDRAVLGQDGPLLLHRQLGKIATASQRIPHAPGPVRVEDGPAGAFDQGLAEVRLVPEGVRAPEHRELGFQTQHLERATVEQRAHDVQEVGGPRTERQDADAARIVQIFVEDTRDRELGKIRGHGGGIAAAAEHQEMHEQPLVGSLRLPSLDASLLAQIRGFDPRAALAGVLFVLWHDSVIPHADARSPDRPPDTVDADGTGSLG